MGSHGWGHKRRGHGGYGGGHGGGHGGHDRDREWRGDYDRPPAPWQDDGRRDSYRQNADWPQDQQDQLDGRSATRFRVPWLMVVAGLAVWTGLAWVIYMLVDPVLGWVAANAGLLASGGQAAATAAGGEAAGAVIGQIDVSTFFGQLLSLLAAIAKPLIVLVWLLGAFALLVAPVVLPRVGRRFLSRRH